MDIKHEHLSLRHCDTNELNSFLDIILGEGIITFTAAHHQDAIKMLQLHFLMSPIFHLNGGDQWATECNHVSNQFWFWSTVSRLVFTQQNL